MIDARPASNLVEHARPKGRLSDAGDREAATSTRGFLRYWQSPFHEEWREESARLIRRVSSAGYDLRDR
jgi:hypothetical protein